jgi:hypothetical protein
VTVVRGHGTGAGQPRVEVSRASALPIGVPWEPEDPTLPASHAAPNADPSPDLPPGGVLGPGAPPADFPKTEPTLGAEQLFPKGPRKFQKGNTIARLGGLAKKDSPRMLAETGIPDVVPFRQFKRLAASFHKFHVQRLARDVGGGECGPAPSMMVKFASFQAASAEYIYREAVKQLEGTPPDVTKATELFQASSKLQNSSRQNLLAAHELCAREALSKRNRQPGSNQSAFEKAFSSP